MAKVDNSSGEGKFTPIIQQYLDLKNQYREYLLMFRLGDFYEMFFEDATVASEELDLVLTGRESGEGRAPMCGVPFHSADGYIAKLIGKGYKIAVAEQMEDPPVAKGLIRREVVRIITPGTVIESGMLSETSNNFIASIFVGDTSCGVAFADVSTGVFYVTGFEGADHIQKLTNETGTFAPSEVLINLPADTLPALSSLLRDRLNAVVDRRDSLSAEKSEELLLKQFGSDSGALGFSGNLERIRAAGTLLDYLYTTQMTDLSYIKNLNIYDEREYMSIDINSRRSLELTASMRGGDKKGSLLWVLDKTKTSLGARLLKRWLEQPLLNCYQIRRRQDAIAALCSDPPGRDELGQSLSGVGDIERIMTKVVYKTANARDLRALCSTLERLPHVKAALAGQKSELLRSLHDGIDELADIRALIDSAIEEEPPHSIREGGMIKSSFHADVEHLRSVMKDGKGWIAKIEAAEREATGIKTLKIGYNKVFGYYIELTKSNVSQAPGRYIRKQTLTGAERYITQELKDMESSILGASDRLVALEGEIFAKVLDVVAGKIHRFQQSAAAVAQADTLYSLSEVSAKNGYACPEVDTSDIIEIRDGRHPVVEKVLGGGYYIPNDTMLDCRDNRLAIITGPNMAGKSTYMRQTAVIVIMAQIGCFVPVKSARIGLVDKVFTRVGASDDLAAGQSTFMLEMSEVAYILYNATKKSLIIYDEIGRGTSTYDGMSIARAVVEYTAGKKLGAKALFATHYHELTELEDSVPGVVNYNIAAKKRGDEITFLRKIVRGGADDSYGIEVAILAGVPQEVISRSKQVLAALEKHEPVKSKTTAKKQDDGGMVSLDDLKNDEIIARIEKLDLNVITPIEAMNILYELKKMTSR
ncbi:MAG: DNA mismatch repair protein MutS [Eubacteriales bacterium]